MASRRERILGEILIPGGRYSCHHVWTPLVQGKIGNRLVLGAQLLRRSDSEAQRQKAFMAQPQPFKISPETPFPPLSRHVRASRLVGPGSCGGSEAAGRRGSSVPAVRALQAACSAPRACGDSGPPPGWPARCVVQRPTRARAGTYYVVYRLRGYAAQDGSVSRCFHLPHLRAIQALLWRRQRASVLHCC